MDANGQHKIKGQSDLNLGFAVFVHYTTCAPSRLRSAKDSIRLSHDFMILVESKACIMNEPWKLEGFLSSY